MSAILSRLFPVAAAKLSKFVAPEAIRPWETRTKNIVMNKLFRPPEKALGPNGASEVVYVKGSEIQAYKKYLESKRIEELQKKLDAPKSAE